MPWVNTSRGVADPLRALQPVRCRAATELHEGEVAHPELVEAAGGGAAARGAKRAAEDLVAVVDVEHETARLVVLRPSRRRR